MNNESHIIDINSEYVLFEKTNSTTYTFTVAVTDLIKHNHEGMADDDGVPFWILRNPETQNIIYVMMDSIQAITSARTYSNSEDPNRIIKLIVK